MRTDWKETIADDEATRFAEYAAVLSKLQEKSSRALHAKGNLGVEADFEVLPDLPKDYGMFSVAKRYPALVRFSNGSPRRQNDRKPDVRGIAIKVIGVEGEKTIPGLERAVTQDFLAIRSPATPVRDAAEFIALVRAAQSPALLPFKLIGALGFRRAIQVIRAALAGFKVPTATLASTTYYSALPSRLGPYAVQYVIRAVDPISNAPKQGELGEALAATLRERPVSYDVCAIFYSDADKTPIEDASVAWQGELVPLAKLTLRQQDVSSQHGQAVAAYVERAAFDPWHARKDMAPLGNMMRARNVAYRASTEARGAAEEPTEMP